MLDEQAGNSIDFETEVSLTEQDKAMIIWLRDDIVKGSKRLIELNQAKLRAQEAIKSAEEEEQQVFQRMKEDRNVYLRFCADKNISPEDIRLNILQPNPEEPIQESNTRGDLIVKILAESGKPMTPRELEPKLVELGDMLPMGEYRFNAITSAMIKDRANRFMKMGKRGKAFLWGLSNWLIEDGDKQSDVKNEEHTSAN